MDEPQRSTSNPAILLAIAGFVVAVDQATKAFAVARLAPHESQPAIDGVLYWTLERNPGAAFSLFTNLPWLFTILATVISVVIIVGARKVRDRLNATALGLILGGAAGNLVDRVLRGPAPFRGHVVDFIDLRWWPVFNIADSAVVVGAVLLVVASIRDDRRSKRAHA